MSHGRQGAGPARPGAQGARLGGAAGRGGHLQEGDEQARLLHAARLLAVRRGRRGRGRAPRSSRSASWSPRRATSSPCTPSSTGSRSTCASAVPRGRRRPSTPRSPPWAPSPCRACAAPRSQLGETAVRHRPRPGRPARGPAAGRRRRPGRRPRHGRGPLPAGREGGRAGLRGPGPTRAWPPVEPALDEHHRAAAVPTTCSWPPAAPPTSRSRPPRELARDRARVVDIGKTRLDLPWNAYYEKELDVRFSRSYGPGPLRRPLRARGHRLPGRLRPLDRAPQPGVLPRPARPQGSSTSRRWSPACSRSTTRPRSTPTWPPATLKAVGRPARTTRRPTADGRAAARRQPVRPARPALARAPHGAGSARLAIGFIGAGNYASSMLLPHLAQLHERRARPRRDDPVAVGGQRAAEVRLHHRVDQRRRPCSTTSRSTRSSS